MWVLWKTKDIDSVATIARKAGLMPEQLRNIFKDFKLRDSLWIDHTPNTPYPIRINGDKIIEAPADHTFKRRKIAYIGENDVPDEEITNQTCLKK